VIAFDGGDYLLYSGSAGVNTGGMTMFAVAAETSTVQFAGVLSAYSGASDNTENGSVNFNTGNAVQFAVLESNGVIAVNNETGALPGAVWAAVSTNGSTLDQHLYRNGNAPYSAGGAASAADVTGGYLIGGRWLSSAVSGSYRLNGWVAEVVTYSSNLSTADKNTVGQYLATKWGFTWTDIT
jgi:hypothetical protein